MTKPNDSALKPILDDVLTLLAGQKFPTPEKGFTGWEDALSSLKRFVRDSRASSTTVPAVAIQGEPSVADAVRIDREPLRKAISEALSHSRHDKDCKWWDDIPRTLCDCGLSNAIQELETLTALKASQPEGSK